LFLTSSYKDRQMSFLSFSKVHGKGDFNLPEDDDDDVMEALCEPMKLKFKWVLWEQVVHTKEKLAITMMQ